MATKMDYFLVYRCADGGYLICPDFVQASVRAEHTYGPLKLLGKVARADLNQMVAGVIDEQVEDGLYAHVAPDQVEALHLDKVEPEPLQIPGSVKRKPA